MTTVLFDIDGTLVDSNDAHASAWAGALAICNDPADLAANFSAGRFAFGTEAR